MCEYPVFTAKFLEKTVIFPLNYFSTLAENQLTINIRVYFWILNPIPLVYIHILMLVLHGVG